MGFLARVRPTMDGESAAAGKALAALVATVGLGRRFASLQPRRAVVVVIRRAIVVVLRSPFKRHAGRELFSGRCADVVT